MYYLLLLLIAGFELIGLTHVTHHAQDTNFVETIGVIIHYNHILSMTTINCYLL